MGYHRYIRVCALLGFFILAGCFSTTPQKKYTFLVLPRTLQNDFHFSLVEGTKTAALEQKVALQIHASAREDDFNFQEKLLEEIINKKNIDGVIITPAHSTKLIPYLRQLDRHNIPFIVVDTPLELSSEPPFNHYCGFIGTDNQRGGGLAAEYVGKTIREGKVLLMRGVMTHRTSQDREIGFLKTIKQYPKIHIEHIVEGQWNSDGAKQALKRFTRNDLTKINAIFAYNDLMVLGIADVLKQYRLHPLIVGYDGILEAQSAIIAGDIDATVTQAPSMMGKRAVEKLKQCIEQQSFQGGVELTHVSLLMATRTLTSVSTYEGKK